MIYATQVDKYMKSDISLKEWPIDIIYKVVGYGIAFGDFEYNELSYYDKTRDDEKKIASAKSRDCMCRYTKLRDIIHELYHIPKQRLCMLC